MAFKASVSQISAGVKLFHPKGGSIAGSEMVYISSMPKTPKKQDVKSKKIKFRETKKGLVIVYTGEGKGKTTAALGLVLRAVGYKKKVLIVQFGKVWFTGELEGVKLLSPFVKIVQGGLGFVKIFDDHSPLSEHVKEANKTFDFLYKETTSGKWDLVVADEIIGAVAGKLLTHSHLKKLIKDRPKHIDLCLTGHHAKESLFRLADLVTEMTPIKHPFEKGFLAKPGVDY